MSDAVKRHPRVDAADVLRGFSVLAIVLLHSIEHFNFYQFPDPSTRGWLAVVDSCVWDSLFFAFSGKAYAIFSLLFGFSFFVQDYNQRLRGADFRLRFCRRLVALFIIGCFDACFFTGEILVMYALIGFVLVPTCRLSTRTVAWLAALCLAQPVCLYYIVRLLADSSYVVPAVDEGALWTAAWQAQDAGTFAEMLRVNLWDILRPWHGPGTTDASSRRPVSSSSACSSDARDGCCVLPYPTGGVRLPQPFSATSPLPESKHACRNGATANSWSNPPCSSTPSPASA